MEMEHDETLLHKPKRTMREKWSVESARRREHSAS